MTSIGLEAIALPKLAIKLELEKDITVIKLSNYFCNKLIEPILATKK